MRWCAWLVLFLVGCSCGDELADLRVDGEYVRCFAADAPEDRNWAHGGIQLQSEGRALMLSGIQGTADVAAGTGPLDDAAVAALNEAAPDVLLLFGPLPESLPDLPFVVLLIPGGSDGPADALADGQGIIDASVYRTVSIGGAELVIVPGAPNGRYALDADRCGYGEDDVDDWEGEGDNRVLVSWAAPTGTPGLEGAESGSPLVDRIAAASGAEGAVFAWPFETSGMNQASPLRVGVRPLSGAPRLAASGAVVPPGVTRLRVSSDGVSAAPAEAPLRGP